MNDELDKERRASLLSSQITLMANILTFVQLATEAKTELGADDVGDIDAAKTPDDLKAIADKVTKDAAGQAQAIQLNYDKSVNQGKGIVIEQSTILRQSGFPSTDVPEIQVYGPQ